MANVFVTGSRLSTAVLALTVLVQSEPPDVVIFNARVYTGVDTQPWAGAVSVRGTRIVAVGAKPTDAR
jgi:hypothetical protein